MVLYFGLDTCLIKLGFVKVIAETKCLLKMYVCYHGNILHECEEYFGCYFCSAVRNVINTLGLITIWTENLM